MRWHLPCPESRHPKQQGDGIRRPKLGVVTERPGPNAEVAPAGTHLEQGTRWGHGECLPPAGTTWLRHLGLEEPLDGQGIQKMLEGLGRYPQESAGKTREWIDDLFDDLRPGFNGSAYQNFIDRGRKNWQQA